MSTLYISQQGSYIRKEDERIKVVFQDKTILDIPIIKVEQVVVFGQVQISTQALLSLLKRGVNICFLTKNGIFRGRIQPKFSKNSLIRRAQYEASLCYAKKLELAKSFTYGKLANMRTLLRRAQRYKSTQLVDVACERITNAITGIKYSDNIDEIRGYEGEAASAYFSCYKTLMKSEKIKFKGRIKRPPTDPVNALLSFGYTLLLNDVLSACEIVGLDPYVGYLHEHKYGKPALALDLMEEWRPVMIDSLAISLINKKAIHSKDFQVEIGNYCKIKEKAKKKFLEAYEKKKRSIIKHPIFGYKTSYWRSIELSARILGKYLCGEIKSYIPFLIR